LLHRYAIYACWIQCVFPTKVASLRDFESAVRHETSAAAAR
jgi:hypothetical protein